MNALLSGSAEDQPVDATTLPDKRVLLFLASGFEDAEVACTLDVFGWTHYRPRVATVSVVTTGLHERVRGAFGTEVAIDAPIDVVDPGSFDALVMPGGFHNLGFDEAYDDRVRGLARAVREGRRPICSMCVGVLPVAEAGLLDGGTAATYALSSRHDNPGRLRELGCAPASEPVVEWEGIISCSGPAFAEQALMRLLERLIGVAGAEEVRRYREGRMCHLS